MISTQRKDRNAENLMRHGTLIVQITGHKPAVGYPGRPAHTTEKVARIKKLLPDAVYTSWSRIRSSLKRAISQCPAEPVVPGSVMEAYAGAPLVKKLGIKANSVVALVGAPPGFEDTLGKLPEGVTLRRGTRGRPDLILWFVRSRRELERDMGKWASRVGKGGMWIIWPKKSSGLQTDVEQNLVRRTGLDAGLVDYKIAAVDQTWSGLKFAVRKDESGG